ncbi:hypothetical protein D3C72_1554320 [compost metagenome]
MYCPAIFDRSFSVCAKPMNWKYGKVVSGTAPAPSTPLNWMRAPGMVPPTTPSPTKSLAGRFGSRLAPSSSNAHWFSFSVGSPVSAFSAPRITFCPLVGSLRVGCTVPVWRGTDESRNVTCQVFCLVSICTLTSSPEPVPPVKAVE